MDEPMVGLADAIRSPRAELSQAMQEGEGQGLRFRGGPGGAGVQAGRDVDQGWPRGIKFWVVTAQEKLDRSTATTHRIKLSLAPLATTAAGDKQDVIVAEEVTGRPK